MGALHTGAMRKEEASRTLVVKASDQLVNAIKHEASMKGVSSAALIRQVLWTYLDEKVEHRERYTMAMAELAK